MNQLGGNRLVNRNIMDNLENSDDINSIFSKLEEQNIEIMKDFIEHNKLELKQFSEKNKDLYSILIIQNSY